MCLIASCEVVHTTHRRGTRRVSGRGPCLRRPLLLRDRREDLVGEWTVAVIRLGAKGWEDDEEK